MQLFDKTGTLTKDTLDLAGIVPVEVGQKQTVTQSTSTSNFSNTITNKNAD